MEVIPAIIPESNDHLVSLIGTLEGSAVSVQIDLVDGVFAGTPSWPFNTEKGEQELLEWVAHNADTYALEFDLMMQDPEELSGRLIRAGASRIVYHYGSTQQLSDVLKEKHGATVGIALKNDTELEVIAPYVSQIDFIQCMGIAEIGVQGNGFDDRVLPRIRQIRATYPGLPISVDGSVTMFTLPLLKEAGATRFVSGSAIFGSDDPRSAYQRLTALAEV